MIYLLIYIILALVTYFIAKASFKSQSKIVGPSSWTKTDRKIILSLLVVWPSLWIILLLMGMEEDDTPAKW